jgi:UrcA family protein
MRRLLFPIALLAAAPAFAQPPAVVVRTTGLDLATAAGAATLDRRIDRAIERLCGIAAPTDLAGQAAIADCRAAALNDLAPRRETLLAAARAAGGGRIALNRR